MRIVKCPRCHQNTLAFTGAFWSCSPCDLIVTSAALAIDYPDLRRHALTSRWWAGKRMTDHR
jgi:hypothetical protein